MEHLAIMKKGYIEKILSSEKKIESRFSLNRVTPYHRIAAGDKVYMQEVGKEVSAVFEVKDVLFFEDLSEEQVEEIRTQYGKDICAEDDFWQLKKNAKYATLIYVKEPREIPPFKVYKNDRSAFKTVRSVKEELVVNRRTIVKHPHDCERGKHYFAFDGHTRCQFCGRSFSHSKTMRARPDYITIKNVMKESMWNDEWLHVELDNAAKSRVKKVSKHEVKKILKNSIGVCRDNDGRQTPYYGNPVYYAQHGLGCYCRKCLEKFYGIPRNTVLSDDDLDYFTNLIMEFVKEHCSEES